MSERKRILIADDNHAHVQSLLDVLSEEGYDVIAADNGGDALLRAVQEPVDLVLLDLMLPVNDGYSVARQMTAKLGKDSPKIFILTGRDMSREKELALASGACAVLEKTLPVPELLQKIREALAGR